MRGSKIRGGGEFGGMECAAKGRGSGCIGQPNRRCGRCGAVAYCSIAHQIAHWSDHKEECARLEEQMMRAPVLNDFPFVFSTEATVQVLEKKVTRCFFLMKRSLHLLGMWKYECNCGASVSSSDYLRINEEWGLSNVLCPCQELIKPMPMHLTSWKGYYEWRCLPLNSPVAMLLHWPLTIYHAIRLAANISSLSEISNELHIHYLGPDKELCQLSVFQELHALFPGLQVHIELIGPAVPQFRDGEKMTLQSYAKCLEIDCVCKSGVENDSGVISGKSSGVTLSFHKGFYHDHCRDMVKDSFPHLIIAPNAGIAAYSSWLPTIELIKDMNVPAMFSDYCEEAAHLAASCISTVTGRPLLFPAAYGSGGECSVPALLLKLLPVWNVMKPLEPVNRLRDRFLQWVLTISSMDGAGSKQIKKGDKLISCSCCTRVCQECGKQLSKDRTTQKLMRGCKFIGGSM